jgi:hypothetical protein
LFIYLAKIINIELSPDVWFVEQRIFFCRVQHLIVEVREKKREREREREKERE